MPQQCCLEFFESIPDDEPVFTLAGRDKLAADTVHFWIQQAREAGVNEDKILRAMRHYDAITRFQVDHPDRVKLPD